MRENGEARFSATGLALTSLVFALSVSALFFPGLMSYDSFYQYSQVTGENPVTNAHPPIMVYLWSILYHITPSPGSLLVFHQFVYWSAVALLSWSLTSNIRGQFFLLVVVGLWPPLIINSLHLWKDVGMFSAMLLSIAALLADIKRRWWGWLIISAVSLFYAYAVRYNAILGMPFIALIWGRRFVDRIGVFERKLVATIIVASTLVGANLFLASAIDGPKDDSGTNSIILFDLAALSVAQDRDMFPGYVVRRDEGDFLSDMKEAFIPEVNSSLNGIVLGVKVGHEADLKRYWLRTNWENLSDYLAHRYHVFSRMLWISGAQPYYPYHPRIEENQYGVKFAFLDGVIGWNWRAFFDGVTHSVVYRPILYLMLSIGIMLYSFFRWKENYNSFKWFSVTAISCSGLSMTFPLFFLAPAADYRYTIWMITTTIISLLISFLLVERKHAANDRFCLGVENA